MVNSLSIELICADENLYACRMVGDHFSLLNLCGLKPEQIRPLLENRICEAEYLLLDDRLMNDSVLLLYLAQTVKPDRILVADFERTATTITAFLSSCWDMTACAYDM